MWRSEGLERSNESVHNVQAQAGYIWMERDVTRLRTAQSNPMSGRGRLHRFMLRSAGGRYTVSKIIMQLCYLSQCNNVTVIPSGRLFGSGGTLLLPSLWSSQNDHAFPAWTPTSARHDLVRQILMVASLITFVGEGVSTGKAIWTLSTTREAAFEQGEGHELLYATTQWSKRCSDGSLLPALP